VAITGSDKTIWVFEHDGAGNLKQLSQRHVPTTETHLLRPSRLTPLPESCPNALAPWH
jgi:tRNA (guanine-N(7)-)-methyltransferase subunit TRM82